LHGLTIETDELGQHLVAEHGHAAIFLLQDDLQQHAAGDVILRLGVDNLDIHVFEHQLLYVSQSDVGTGRRIVQATVRVLLDDPFFNTHVTLPDYCRWCCAPAIYHKYNKLEQNFYALYAVHATFRLHCAVQYKNRYNQYRACRSFPRNLMMRLKTCSIPTIN
jgi:hypothetical protein